LPRSATPAVPSTDINGVRCTATGLGQIQGVVSNGLGSHSFSDLIGCICAAKSPPESCLKMVSLRPLRAIWRVTKKRKAVPWCTAASNAKWRSCRVWVCRVRFPDEHHLIDISDTTHTIYYRGHWLRVCDLILHVVYPSHKLHRSRGPGETRNTRTDFR
jgi:hypothetical protein